MLHNGHIVMIKDRSLAKIVVGDRSMYVLFITSTGFERRAYDDPPGGFHVALQKIIDDLTREGFVEATSEQAATLSCKLASARKVQEERDRKEAIARIEAAIVENIVIPDFVLI